MAITIKSRFFSSDRILQWVTFILIVFSLFNPLLSTAQSTTSTCSGVSFSYTLPGAPGGTTYTWTNPVQNPLTGLTGASAQITPQTSVTQTLVNTTSTVATATYTVTASSGPIFTLTVTVNPTPTLNSTLTPTAVCSGAAFSYTPTSGTTGTNTYNWTRAVVAGISNSAGSGTNNPNEALTNITSSPVTVNYSYQLITSAGCTNTQTVAVSVNPAPSLSSTLTPASVCSGTIFNYTPQSSVTGATFSWSRNTVPSISNPAASGINNPAETLVNTSVNNVSVPYLFTISANGCSAGNTVTVSVNPAPIISNVTTTSCSNSAFTVSPAGVPAGTQYTWATPLYTPAASLTGGTSQAVLQNNISQTLVSQTINNAVATYTVTPVANGCTGATFTIAVTVNPTPVINNQLLAPVCSGTAFSYSAIATTVPNATTYTWSNPLQSPLASLTGAGSQSVSQTRVSQTLSSINNLTDTAFYTVTPTAGNGCSGNTFILTVPVNPVPVINTISDTICSGSSFLVSPSPVPANTGYTWTTPVSSPFGAITGGKLQSTPLPSISQTLVNTTKNTAQLVYTITPVSAGCVGNSFTLLETVGATLSAIPNQNATICSGTSFDVTPVSTPPNTTYTWAIPVSTPAGIISGASGKSSPQTIISQTLTNLGNVAATVVYTIQPYNTGCKGSTFTATILVRPVPKATITGNAVICDYPSDTLTVSFAGTAPWSFTYTDNGTVYTKSGITTSPYTWLVPTPSGISLRNLSITNVKDFACVDSTDTSIIIQKINRLPQGKINSLHGQYICNGITDTLFVSYSPLDTLSFQWTLNGANLTGITTDSIGTVSGGKYNVLLTNQFGCTDTAISSVTLTVISPPKLAFSYDSYCINRLINFTNQTDTSFTGPIQWLWDLGDSTTANTYHTSDTYLGGGDRHVRLSATQQYCPAYTTYLDTTINIQYPIAPVRLPSVSAYKNVFTPVSARVIPGYRYLWTPTRGIDLPDSAVANFNYQNTQDYVINLISPGGCITYDSLLVRVFDNSLVDIMVPKSFTPNGDGVNDILYPYLAGIKTFQYFKVYNRYGKIMFETTNPDTGWNGTLNGTPQPMSIYIWIAVGIANDGTAVQKRGETLLLR